MKTKTTKLHRFDNVWDLCDAAARPAAEDTSPITMTKYYVGLNRQTQTRLTRVENPGFDGDMSFDDAVSAAKFGTWYPTGDLADLRDAAAAVVPKIRRALGFQFERISDVAGDTVDMVAYCEGLPESMIDWMAVEGEQRKGVVTILVDVALRGCTMCDYLGCSASPAITAEDAFRTGQAIVGLTRALKLLGLELEVWTEVTVEVPGVRRDERELDTWLIRVQRAGEITDESTLEFCIGHPAFSRKLVMSAMENDKDAKRKGFGFDGVGYGYGRLVREDVGSKLINADIKISLGKRVPDGEDAMVDWVVDRLVECGAISEEQGQEVRDA